VDDDYKWPQAPILAELPPVARLGLSFDPDRLLEDLDMVSGRAWARLKSKAQAGSDTAQLGWESLALRAVDGDEMRTDPGGPGLSEFADTPLLAEAPYLAQVLHTIPAPLRGARLLALRPGAHSPVHVDPAYGLPWGTLRLHVPILVVPGARLEIGGVSHTWQPGTLWYADFTRPHRVRNDGPDTRVHLVIDSHVTPALLELFPTEFRTPAVRAQVLFDRTESPSPWETRDDLRCRFCPVPSSGDGGPAGPMTARIDWYDGSLGLFLDGAPAFRLVHVGGGEFRFAGWTTQRTVRVDPAADRRTVTMIMRTGSSEHAMTLAAAPLEDA
jgi:hypothetical protein